MKTGLAAFNRWVASLIALASLAAGGCGGHPPIGSITNAQTAIDKARENDAVSYAPVEFKLAQEKLRRARFALDEEQYDEARRLAEEAAADAELAQAKARTEKEKAFAREMRESVDILRQELNRTEPIQR